MAEPKPLFDDANIRPYAASALNMQKAATQKPEEMAIAMEIMMVETRPMGAARGALRGAICMVRGESTPTTLLDAVRSVQGIKGVMAKKNLHHRVIICDRTIQLLERNANA